MHPLQTIRRSQIPQGEKLVRFSANISLFFLLVFAFFFFSWVYKFALQDSNLGRAIRLPDLELGTYYSNLLAGALYVIFPLLWVRRSDAPSKSFYVYILFAVFVPSVLFTITNQSLEILSRHIKCCVLMLCMFIIYAQVYLPRISSLDAYVNKRAVLFTVILLGGVAPFVLLVQNPTAISNISFLDVYEQRLELRDALSAGQASRLNVYLTNWLGVAVAPFLTAMGIYLKKKWMIFAALVIALIAFSVSTHKAVFFSSLIVLLFAFCLAVSRRFGIRPSTRYLGFGYTILFGLLLPAFFLDLIFFNSGGRVTLLVTFRMFLNNGYLTSIYFEYFESQEVLLYADSFLRGIVQSSYDLSYSRRVGDYIGLYASRNNANANFLADGYVNMGYFGMVFSAAQASLVFYLVDCFSFNKNKAIVVCMFLPSVFIFTNAPIHTALSSNGALLALLLLRLVPEEARKGTVA